MYIPVPLTQYVPSYTSLVWIAAYCCHLLMRVSVHKKKKLGVNASLLCWLIYRSLPIKTLEYQKTHPLDENACVPSSLPPLPVSAYVLCYGNQLIDAITFTCAFQMSMLAWPHSLTRKEVCWQWALSWLCWVSSCTSKSDRVFIQDNCRFLLIFVYRNKTLIMIQLYSIQYTNTHRPQVV